MEERNIVKLKKDEFAIKEYIKSILGKGKISRVKIEYTPVGEKVVVATNKPGLIIGKRGEKIDELTQILKTKFKMENPKVDIEEITQPEFDAQIIADEIALGIEKLGPMKFKVIAYKTLQRVMGAGALGIEIRLSGKLPSARARSWRFAQGYLKKIGDSAKVVNRAQARAETKPGTVGIKVSILSPHAILKDKLNLSPEVISKMKINAATESIEEEKPKKSRKKKTEKENQEDSK